MSIDRAAVLRVIDGFAEGAEVEATTPPADLNAFNPEELLVSDGLLRYISEGREAYAGLRHCAGQLASLLLMKAIGGGVWLSDQPLLMAAEEEFRAAQDKLLSLTAPDHARAHVDHLQRAARLFGDVLRRLRQGRLAGAANPVEDCLEAMKTAWSEMHLAARMLPGFQTVSFGQTCCAAHAEAFRRRFQAN